MLGDKKSIDPEDVRAPGRNEDRIDHVERALEDLNKNWDFWEVVHPLLADQGPALTLSENRQIRWALSCNRCFGYS